VPSTAEEGFKALITGFKLKGQQQCHHLAHGIDLVVAAGKFVDIATVTERALDAGIIGDGGAVGRITVHVALAFGDIPDTPTSARDWQYLQMLGSGDGAAWPGVQVPLASTPRAQLMGSQDSIAGRTGGDGDCKTALQGQGRSPRAWVLRQRIRGLAEVACETANAISNPSSAGQHGQRLAQQDPICSETDHHWQQRTVSRGAVASVISRLEWLRHLFTSKDGEVLWEHAERLEAKRVADDAVALAASRDSDEGTKTAGPRTGQLPPFGHQ